MTTSPQASVRNRRLRHACAIAGLAVSLGACTHARDEVTASVPTDYRQRHPIVVQEADRTIDVFVGAGRGGLTTAQRTDITALGQTWLSEGTGAIVIDVPKNTPNERAAKDSLREIRSMLASTGVPSRGVSVRSYQPTDPKQFATIRVTYPRILADAGPCGLWPDDIGPSIKNRGYLENRPYHNFGCSYQRNMAAMVENPADLVQPRPEAPAYAPRRAIAYDKYRKGTATSTTYPEADKAKLSDLGK